MLPLEEVDHSMYLQCPMPGQLISLSVKEGDSVEVGQVKSRSPLHSWMGPRPFRWASHTAMLSNFDTTPPTLPHPIPLFSSALQELAVVEAMKMQNILRAPRRATVKKVRVAAGVSLKVDQIILDFDE